MLNSSQTQISVIFPFIGFVIWHVKTKWIFILDYIQKVPLRMVSYIFGTHINQF